MIFQKCMFFITGLLLGSLSCITAENKENLALHKSVIVSSQNKDYPASNVTDGIVSRSSSWVSGDESRPPHLLDLNLQQYCDINRIIIYTGISENEKMESEKDQAPGFWSMKNMKLQYWDDANWTDLPNTEVFENRLNKLEFFFTPVLTTFQIRLISTDGEPIRINEIEVYGTIKKNMPVPEALESNHESSLKSHQKTISATITKEVVGKSMKYVAYNQGYYLPGSNTSGWLEYSNVNSLRVWTSLQDYVPLSSIHVDKKLNSLSEFEKYKEELRGAPENNRFIKWESILAECNEAKHTTNAMVFEYALLELKRMGIDVVLQINSSDWQDNWSNKWQQWQRYYSLAFYAAKVGDVTMFAMQNEPNHRHSGPMKIDQYIEGMRIASDAIYCAIQDVNRIYDKKLESLFVSPVTAGSNANWWAEVIKNIRIDYRGLPANKDLIDIFSTHSYNLPAAGYATKVSDIRKIIVANHPLGYALPIVYTETGRWMNAYLIDKEETMDSPSLFTEWAGEYTNNTLNGGYGMWAFKFANTTSSTYPRGIKSGHHFTWQGKRIIEESFKNVALGKKATVSTSKYYHSTMKITDGDKDDHSAWISPDTEDEKYVEIDLKHNYSLGGAIVYTGSSYGVYTGPDRVKKCRLQYWTGTIWKDIEQTQEEMARYTQLFYEFDEPIYTSKVRFISSDKGSIRIREIKLFASDSMRKIPISYDISGIQRTGEVVRLFAKGFKNERPLLKINRSSIDQDIDILASFDSQSMTYYVWLVQRNTAATDIDLDLADFKLSLGTRVIAQEVSDKYYGGVKWIKTLGSSDSLHFELPRQSVMLLTIPVDNSDGYQEVKSTADTKVVSGKFSHKNFGQENELTISTNPLSANNNHVSYLKFDLNKINLNTLNAAVLKVHGGCKDGNYKMHVYAIDNTDWDENQLNWDNAPNLDKEEVRITNVGHTAHVAGELEFSGSANSRMLDVTSLVQKCKNKKITFVFIREARHLGDDLDKNKTCILSTRDDNNSPVLMIW